MEVNNIKQDQLINEQIRFREVQVIDEQGNKLGKMNTHEAIDLAEGKDLDLVLVSSNPENPVCKLMDYGKYKFEQSKREKESKKKQKTVEVKEIRVTPNIEEHDFNFKTKNAKKFLEDGSKVKITVRFRGRELSYAKLGEQVLNKFVESLSEVSTLEKKPLLEGKNMFIILAPINK
ncbi:MAG TPA: translation initiation factor IF-3 [Clostridiaceae bacterium]|nr:translation initiation factor IF-3 [Clostridiaceae bacterium]